VNEPTVSVIVPARDAEATLPRALDGLARQPPVEPHEVIVVDNGSRDRTAELAERSRLVTRVLQRERGAGPGAARNAGAAAARGAILVFVDADCRPAEGWLNAGVAALRSADLVQGMVLPEPTTPGGPFDRTLAVGLPTGLFESANLFVRRDLFELLGGFPDGLEGRRSAWGRGGAPFGEDVIFGWRARRAGARTEFCEGALVYHEVTPRGPAEFIAERTRRAMFPALAQAVPELRDAFFYRRLFLNRRSARFDLAVGGAAVALISGRRTALMTTAPYLLEVAVGARRWGIRRAPAVALTEAVADAVGAVALACGSVAARTPVL
jgi:glycosyltransferase involved in cell wall biosynthesis